jgi:hypothetical protein
VTAAHLIPADVSKEIRALLPLWLGCVVIVWAGGIHDGDLLFLRAGIVMYILGSAALGALSVGHEYTNRTLPLLLSVPTSRRRLFAIKTSVLLAMLVSLAAVALARLPVTPAGREMQDTAVVGTMSFLGGAFLAPWLTMLCRNPIAGALFALSIPAGLLVGSEILTIAALAQVGTPTAERFRMEIFWGAMLVLSVVGGFSSWRAFLELQVIEGPHAELALPEWLSRSGARHVSRRASPVRALLSKELHLQQLTFMVSVLYVCGWTAILLTWHSTVTIIGQPFLRHSTVITIDQPFLILTVVHGAMVALLAGSLASAEERQLGTLDWQLLLPISAARQWLVKCGVVFGMAIVLGLALPALLGVIKPSIEPMRMNWAFASTLVVAAAVSLYVSSLCGSGLKALLIAAPAAFATLPVLELSQGVVSAVLQPQGIARADIQLMGDGRTMAVQAAVMIALLLRFALVNHRSNDRGTLRLVRQLIWTVGAMVLSAVAVTAAQMLASRP